MNSEFFPPLDRLIQQVKRPQYALQLAEVARRFNVFCKNISTKWKANNHLQDSNFVHKAHLQ